MPLFVKEKAKVDLRVVDDTAIVSAPNAVILNFILCSSLYFVLLGLTDGRNGFLVNQEMRICCQLMSFR